MVRFGTKRVEASPPFSIIKSIKKPALELFPKRVLKLYKLKGT